MACCPDSGCAPCIGQRILKGGDCKRKISGELECLFLENRCHIDIGNMQKDPALPKVFITFVTSPSAPPAILYEVPFKKNQAFVNLEPVINEAEDTYDYQYTGTMKLFNNAVTLSAMEEWFDAETFLIYKYSGEDFYRVSGVNSRGVRLNFGGFGRAEGADSPNNITINISGRTVESEYILDTGDFNLLQQQLCNLVVTSNPLN